MEREIDYLISVYTLEEIFQICDLDEKEVLLYLIDEGVLTIDVETIINNDIQIEPRPFQD